MGYMVILYSNIPKAIFYLLKVDYEGLGRIYESGFRVVGRNQDDRKASPSQTLAILLVR